MRAGDSEERAWRCQCRSRENNGSSFGPRSYKYSLCSCSTRVCTNALLNYVPVKSDGFPKPAVGLRVSQTLWRSDAFPAGLGRASSGRCSEAVGGDAGSVPGHARGVDGALRTATGCPRRLPLSSLLVGQHCSAPSSTSARPSKSRCVHLPWAVPACGGVCVCWGQPLSPRVPPTLLSPQLGGCALVMLQCSRFASGLGKGEPASPNSRGSDPALSQLGWGFLLLFGCETECGAGAANVQPHRSSVAVNTATGALVFIGNENVSWFGDPSLTSPSANSLWDPNATGLLLRRATAAREHALAGAQHPHGQGCGAEPRVKLISGDGGVDAFG